MPILWGPARFYILTQPHTHAMHISTPLQFPLLVDPRKLRSSFRAIQVLVLLAPLWATASINLAWDDMSDNEDGFVLERRDLDAGGDWTTLAELPIDSVSYTDDTVVPGSAYEYRVYAYNEAGDSEFSNIADGTAPIVYATWLNSNFSPAEIADPSISGNQQDPDADGLANILEYALGMDPNMQEPSPPIEVFVDPQGNENYAGLQFKRISYVDDINYVVVGSVDLFNWMEIARSNRGAAFQGAASVAEEGEKLLTTRVTHMAPLGAEPQFLRLQIEY